MDVITFPVNLLTTSGLSILLHGVISLPDATSYDQICFKKRDSHLVTYRSGNTATQIDFVLYQKSMPKLVMDVKEIPGEEVALQNQLLVCNMMIDILPQIKCKYTPRVKCGNPEILKCVADSRKSSMHMCPL